MKLKIYRPYLVQFDMGNLPRETRQEVINWLLTETQGHFEILCPDRYLTFNKEETINDTDKDYESGDQFFLFENQKDSLLFKMTWVGR